MILGLVEVLVDFVRFRACLTFLGIELIPCDFHECVHICPDTFILIHCIQMDLHVSGIYNKSHLLSSPLYHLIRHSLTLSGISDTCESHQIHKYTCKYCLPIVIYMFLGYITNSRSPPSHLACLSPYFNIFNGEKICIYLNI